MSQDGIPELQRNVQRLMGRCLIRLQQYERLMKAVLVQHELAGPIDTLEARRADRVEQFSGMTLGTLVKSLFETYAVSNGHERELLPAKKMPTDRASMAISYRLTMEPQQLAEIRAAMEELVAMRNELVHQLIERFNLWSQEGCVAAASHLEGCFGRIEHHFAELVTWARGLDESRALMAAYVKTEAFHDMVVNGIAPDGRFNWAYSGIVSVLREAAGNMSESGWTRLSRAQAWIASSHPEQTPAKYGCKTWPQVLAESRMFDLEYRIADDGRKQAWFRLRPGC